MSNKTEYTAAQLAGILEGNKQIFDDSEVEGRWRPLNKQETRLAKRYLARAVQRDEFYRAEVRKAELLDRSARQAAAALKLAAANQAINKIATA